MADWKILKGVLTIDRHNKGRDQGEGRKENERTALFNY